MKRHNRKVAGSLLLLLIAAGVFPFLYPWNQPLLSWQKLRDDLLSLDLKARLPALPGSDAPKPVEVYRWRDSNGSWAFGDSPPQGVAYERMTVNPETNLLPSLPLESEQPRPNPPASGEDSPTPGTLPKGYSADEIADLTAAAHRAREAMEQRRAEERAILEE